MSQDRARSPEPPRQGGGDKRDLPRPPRSRPGPAPAPAAPAAPPADSPAPPAVEGDPVLVEKFCIIGMPDTVPMLLNPEDLRSRIRSTWLQKRTTYDDPVKAFQDMKPGQIVLAIEATYRIVGVVRPAVRPLREALPDKQKK